MRQKKSWEISQAFWEVTEPLIPHSERDSYKEYLRKPGGGRPRSANYSFVNNGTVARGNMHGRSA
jgi:hypothetical protein